MTGYVPGDTALIMPVPQAEPAVGGWRARHDESARHGVPAHVTVLVPFLPAERIDADVADALGELVGSVPRFDVRFAAFARFPDGVLYLEPDPSRPR